jgi:hypothetical protein
LNRTHSVASTSPFDEQEDRGALLLAAFNRRRSKQGRPLLPTTNSKLDAGSRGSMGRELNDNTGASLDELHHEVKTNLEHTAKEARGDKDSKQDLEQILRVCICVDPNCRGGSKCRPPDTLKDAKSLEQIINDPSIFYLPVSLILRREAEMKEAAKATKVPKSRWNGSLLYRQWQEIQQKERQLEEQRHDTDSITTTRSTKVLTCFLHPVQSLAEAQVVSPKFTWWQPWVTVCIRAYYNTGTIRIPSKCHGLEILLALEFFGILYGSTDQLAFDDSGVYQKVKHWSRYFTHRAALAQWVVDTLRQRRLEEQELQDLQAPSARTRSFRPPFVFCTHPKPVEPGWTFTIEPLRKPIIVFQGGLELMEDDEEGKKARRKKRPTSEQMVHGFFVPSLKNGKHATRHNLYSNPEMVPGMMREDFKSYLLQVLPGVELTFAIKEVQLVSNHLVMGRKKKRYHGDSMRRAVLVVSFNPSPTKPFQPVYHPHPVYPTEDLVTISVSKHTEHVVSTLKGDPPGRNTVQGAKHDTPSPILQESLAQPASAASSVSNAPTDEMAFEKFLHDTHNAVVSLFQQTAKKRLIRRDCTGRNENFDFHSGFKETPNNTPDTTGSSEASLLLEEPVVSAACRPQSSQSTDIHVGDLRNNDKCCGPAHEGVALDKKHRAQVLNETNQLGFATLCQDNTEVQKKEVRDAKKERAATAMTANQPTKVPSRKEPKHVGYGASAVDTSHIYGGDLFFESMFTTEAVPKPGPTGLKRAATDTSQQSPVWTPSVIGPDDDATGELTSQRPAQAPMNYVAASPKDHLSVASEITGQLSMMTNPFKVNVQGTRQNTVTQTPISPATEQEADVDRHSSMVACETVKRSFGLLGEQNAAGFVVTDDDDTSAVQNLHDKSFEARFDALLREDGEPYKKYRRKQNRKMRTKNNLQAALNDLKFGLSTEDIDECQKAATSQRLESDVNGDSCHFLTDIFEVFVPSSYKPFAVGCEGLSSKPGKASRGSATNSTLGSTTLSSVGSITSWSQRQRSRTSFPMDEALGVTAEEGVNSATYWMQLFSVQSAVPEMPSQILTPASRDVGNSKTAKTLIVPPTEKQSPEVEDEGKGGFEVYHIPTTRTITEDTAASPVRSPAERLLVMQRKTQLPPTYRGPVRDRTHPLREVPTRPKDAHKKVDRKNKGLLSFLRKR